jgi:hypothetical protein
MVGEVAGRSPLAERDREVRVLRGVVERAAAGLGGVAFVVGEAGIGKSRLLDEVAAMAAGLGLAVLRGHAVEGGGAYRAIAQAVSRLDAPAADAALRPNLPALGRLRPDWAAAGPAETSVDPALVLGEGLIRVLSRSGAVLLLDDLHWADVDTVAVVEHLAGAVADRPVAVIAAARDEEPATRELQQLLRRRDLTVIRPGRLSPAAVVALAEQRAGRPLTEADRRTLPQPRH